MAIRNRSMTPWWLYAILAVVIYTAFRYGISSVQSANSFLAKPMEAFAPIFAGILLILAVMSAFNAVRKGNLLDRQKGIETIRSISWQEFEELVGEAYRRRGYTVAETGKGGADGGVDLVLKKGGEQLLVQCKHWKVQKISVKTVRELYGVVAAEGASGGVVITSGHFTQDAKAFAQGKPLELLDGLALLNLIAEIQKKPMPAAAPPNENICPLCGAAMVLRTAKKGPEAGKQFWGCSAFPKCRGQRQLNSSS